jgi:hypothetical protein
MLRIGDCAATERKIRDPLFLALIEPKPTMQDALGTSVVIGCWNYFPVIQGKLGSE